MSLRSFALCLCLGLCPPALACEPVAVFYEPMRAALPWNPQKQAFVESTAPEIGGVGLGRGTDAEASLCGGQGYLEIELIMPAGAPYDFTEIGFEFRIAEGAFPEIAYPQGPVISAIEPDRRFILLGSWFEGPPRRQSPIAAVMEVRFVAPDGTRGPAARIPLISEPERPAPAQGNKKTGGATR